jgi:hypothetical protein
LGGIERVFIITAYRGHLPANEGTKTGNVRLINAIPKEPWKVIGALRIISLY